LGNGIAESGGIAIWGEADYVHIGQKSSFFIVGNVGIDDLPDSIVGIRPPGIVGRWIGRRPIGSPRHIAIYRDVESIKRLLQVEDDGHI
jgi:hypothetical protein